MYNTAMKMITALSATTVALSAAAKDIVPQPLPPPVIRVVDMRANEKPVAVEKTEATVEENTFFKRVRTTFTFTNPNARVMSGEFEFPIPDGAFVCGYSLEVNGEMVPGVVCEKEKARVAFENETKKGVDPGIVEHVKGNIWKTRIFPLSPNAPRKAEVDYVAPKSFGEDCISVVFERDGDDYFLASISGRDGKAPQTVRDKIAGFTKGTIIWDASLSAKAHAAAWRKKLEALPEKGEWALIVFSNRCVGYAKSEKTKESLLKEIDEIVYDGGTDFGRIRKTLPLGNAEHGEYADSPMPALLFTDEIDTLGLEKPDYESIPGLTIASRDDAPVRAVEVRKLKPGEEKLMSLGPVEGKLLATIWAARRMDDLASQADARKDEFLSLGRKYGVAGPGLSLIVLENLNQWLEHKIEPPANLAIHDEWVRRRAAEDDPIAEKKAKAEHEQNLLRYWEERVKWWNDPKPPKRTPKSGLFDTAPEMDRLVARAGEASGAAPIVANASGRGVRANMSVRRSAVMAEAAAAAPDDGIVAGEMREMPAEKASRSAPGAAGSGAAPTVTLKPWDPKAPYVDALKGAKKGEAYKVYLKERDTYGSSPAFYLDCASWFFKAGETMYAERILTNLAEFKLEDAALWRSMGWRAREAGDYELAILAFRKALLLRGEEAQSRRDLALVLMESGKAWIADGDKERLLEIVNRAIMLRNCYEPNDTPERRIKDHAEIARTQLEEAMKLFAEAAFKTSARRSGRRGNDFQVSVIALEELNGLISWVNAVKWPAGEKPAVPKFDEAYRRDLPMKLRIVMSWDADETDIDIHVLEPNGEEAFYRNRRTAEGGFVSEDVTTGYGPEEYLKKDLERGKYKVLSNYFASHQTALTGATTVTATVYTDWGTAEEKRQIMTLRLDKPKDKHLIGEVEM